MPSRNEEPNKNKTQDKHGNGNNNNNRTEQPYKIYGWVGSWAGEMENGIGDVGKRRSIGVVNK